MATLFPKKKYMLTDTAGQRPGRNGTALGHFLWVCVVLWEIRRLSACVYVYVHAYACMHAHA